MLFYSHKTHCEHLGSFVCPSPPSHLDVDHRWVCIQQLAEVGPDVLLRDREDAGDTGEVRVLCNGWKDACAASFTHPPPPFERGSGEGRTATLAENISCLFRLSRIPTKATHTLCGDSLGFCAMMVASRLPSTYPASCIFLTCPAATGTGTTAAHHVSAGQQGRLHLHHMWHTYAKTPLFEGNGDHTQFCFRPLPRKHNQPAYRLLDKDV